MQNKDLHIPDVIDLQTLVSKAIFENKGKFSELLSYSACINNQISYERKKEYYSLISQYIENLITTPMFQSEFLKMEKDDAKAAKMITTIANIS